MAVDGRVVALQLSLAILSILAFSCKGLAMASYGMNPPGFPRTILKFGIS